MESLFTSVAILPPSVSSSPCMFSSSSGRLLRIPALFEQDRSDSPNDHNNLLPVLSIRTLSKPPLGDGPPITPTDENSSGMDKVSTFPWSLFTQSPLRRMRVAFTCNVSGQRTTRAINPHAYTEGTMFVQLVDQSELFHEMKCYLNPSFNYKEPQWDDVGLEYLNMIEIRFAMIPVEMILS